jgi:hypothetical protein
MRLRTARAIYKDGNLVFADPALAPKDVTEVIVTYVEPSEVETAGQSDPIQALRGRGRGERLTERLLQSRREDRRC